MVNAPPASELAVHTSTVIGIMEPGNLTIRRLVTRVAPEAITTFEDGMIVVRVPLLDLATASGARS